MHTHVSPESLGLSLTAFVFVGWSEVEVEAAFLKRVASAEQVLECHHVTGGWNYLLKIRVKDTRALEDVSGRRAEAGRRPAAHGNADRAVLAQGDGYCRRVSAPGFTSVRRAPISRPEIQPFSRGSDRMAGHSHAKNIMHRKGKSDAARSKVFSKLAREITVAAKLGVPDLAFNSRLRLAVATARGQSMPKDNIDRAIKKAIGSEGENYEEIRYEGYGPGGVAIIVEALTDNRNRTASNVRSTFSKNGGALGETNSVGFMFDRVGEIFYPAKAGSADKVDGSGDRSGADDVESDEEGHYIYTSFEAMNETAAALEKLLGEPESAKFIFKPQNDVPVDADKGATLMKLIGLLEEDDDVQNVYANFDISDEDLAKIEA